jgi:glycosyltransferase involved in cell wall biosynthesis
VECEAVEVIHTGINPQHFAPRDVPKEDRPTIVFVGKIVANKGVDVLVEAVCRLIIDIPDLQLRLIGSGEQDLIQKLQMQAASTGRSDILDVIGFVGQKDLPDHLSRAHVFAAPSFYEGGPGFVYLEAMACGLPVIACSGSGASEVVIPEENGLLVEPGDVEGLVEALRRLISSSSYREAMGGHARDYAVDHADSQKCLVQMERFYANVIATTLSSSHGVQIDDRDFCANSDAERLR